MKIFFGLAMAAERTANLPEKGWGGIQIAKRNFKKIKERSMLSLAPPCTLRAVQPAKGLNKLDLAPFFLLFY